MTRLDSRYCSSNFFFAILNNREEHNSSSGRSCPSSPRSHSFYLKINRNSIVTSKRAPGWVLFLVHISSRTKKKNRSGPSRFSQQRSNHFVFIYYFHCLCPLLQSIRNHTFSFLKTWSFRGKKTEFLSSNAPSNETEPFLFFKKRIPGWKTRRYFRRNEPRESFSTFFPHPVSMSWNRPHVSLLTFFPPKSEMQGSAWWRWIRVKN